MTEQEHERTEFEALEPDRCPFRLDEMPCQLERFHPGDHMADGPGEWIAGLERRLAEAREALLEEHLRSMSWEAQNPPMRDGREHLQHLQDRDFVWARSWCTACRALAREEARS